VKKKLYQIWKNENHKRKNVKKERELVINYYITEYYGTLVYITEALKGQLYVFSFISLL